LTAIYGAFVEGKPSPLPPLALQYTDYAAWQQSALSGEAIEPHLEYWRKQLAGAPPVLELPTDHPRPVVETFHGARHFIELDKTLITELGAVGRKESCTLFMVLLAAFQTLLAKYAEREDILVGSPIANRNRAETEALIGSFMNTLVLRSDLSGDPAFTELLKRVRRVCLDAYAHQDLPFEKLVADLQPQRNLGYGPLFQVMFILQNTPMPTGKVGSLTFRHFDVDAGTSKLDLTLNLEETENGAIGWIEYATDLFEKESIVTMGQHFETLLRNIAAAPSQRLSKLDLTQDGSRWQFPAGTKPRITSGAGMTEAQVIDHVATPTAVDMLQVDGMPSDLRNTSGKNSATPPSTVQTQLGEIWKDVLGVDEVNAGDNLFDLGGHSLLITRIISRIRKSFGVEVPIHAFFETPTMGAIAAIIENKGERRTGLSSPIQRLARR